ncbi:MAG: glycosyltransferase [Anaerolineae bacterium]
MIEQLFEEQRITPPERNGRARTARRLKVAYIMSRFPKLTETFILYEILALEQQGVQIELYPLLRERSPVMHPEAAPLVERAHFQPFFSRHILHAQVHFLRRKPRAYLGTLWALLRGTWGSLRFFTGALGIFPKTVCFAHQMATDGVTHVHAHFASHPAAAGFIIQRLVGIPYSFTAHGSDLHRDRHMLHEKVAEAAFVVPISNYNKDLIIEECGEQFRDKVFVNHCGVDTQVFRPEQGSRGAEEQRSRGAGVLAVCRRTPLQRTRALHIGSGDPSSPQDMDSPGPLTRFSDKLLGCQGAKEIAREGARPFTILCVGTLHEVKGQTHLIEACRLLKDRGIDFACHFVGDGPDREALTRQIAQAGLADCVQFLGQRTRAEIAELLRNAGVVAAPSVPTSIGRREGIPVVLMEAMASGVPVVASDISGIPELVEDEHNGLLVPPRDAWALADALERLHGDPALCRRLGQAGRNKVLREFDLHTNAAALAQHFTPVLSVAERAEDPP